MSYAFDLTSAFNLAAVTLGGVLVYKMLTIPLGRPEAVPEDPQAQQDVFFMPDGENNFMVYWELLLNSGDVRKTNSLKNITISVAEMDEYTYIVQILPMFPQRFRVDKETVSLILSNQKKWGYKYTSSSKA